MRERAREVDDGRRVKGPVVFGRELLVEACVGTGDAVPEGRRETGSALDRPASGRAAPFPSRGATKVRSARTVTRGSAPRWIGRFRAILSSRFKIGINRSTAKCSRYGVMTVLRQPKTRKSLQANEPE